MIDPTNIKAIAKQAFPSYRTLVGVKKDGRCYFQRDGRAASRTTGRHLTLAGYRHGTEVADEAALEGIAFPSKKPRARRAAQA